MNLTCSKLKEIVNELIHKIVDCLNNNISLKNLIYINKTLKTVLESGVCS